MLLHFIFVVKEEELEESKKEFEYIEQMGIFFQMWIKEKFSIDVEIRTDEMITKKRSILDRLDTHTLLRDHRSRGSDVFHFYLCHFRPMWTDCTCEGYHAENFGMMYWQKPIQKNELKNKRDEKTEKEEHDLFLAEKNCTIVSHELAHEFLRQAKYKKYVEDIHDLWAKHWFSDLPFEQYDKNFKKNTNKKPMFLAMDISSLNYLV